MKRYMWRSFFVNIAAGINKEFIKNQKNSSSDDVLDMLKEMFKDVFQEVLEM